MTSHLTPAQVELIDQFEACEFGDVEFTEMALEAGLSIARIERALRDRRTIESIEAEDEAEARAANGQFGAGA